MKLKSGISILLSFLFVLTANATLIPVRLTCEYLVDPSVIDARHPRLSWINTAAPGERGQQQTAYQIRVASSADKLKKEQADLWDSGKKKSSQSFLVRYEGKPLQSRQECWWQVRVWDANGKISDWSEPARWNMGLLNADEWKAQWIGAPWQGEEATAKSADKTLPPAPLFRKDFTVSKEIASAKIYISGLGYFELYLNGEKVGNDVLVPNQTNYGKRDDLDVTRVTLDDNFRGYNVLYLCYDLKEALKQGKNALGYLLGNGFYNAALSWTMPYGSPRLIAQLHIGYTDGSEEVITSDTSWKVSRSAIVLDGIYQGEHYDARLEQPDWCSPDKPADGWESAVVRKAPEGELQAQMSHSDKVMEVLKPKKITRLENGNYKVDFGEEISGWVHLHNMQGEAGRKVEIRYICESPNGSNSYTMKGGGPESYAARFTWFVFREAEIINWPGELREDNLTAEAVYTEIETTGHFECSNPLFNQINKIWRRSLTDNSHGSIISDCPHRERSAYTGDGQVACVTVMHNYDAAALYTKWIKDILLAQNKATGYVPNGAPWQPGCGGGVAWGAAMNIMPWEFYLHYADKDLLAANYTGMKEQLRYMQTWVDSDGIMLSQIKSNGNVSEWHNLGEWCPADGFPPKDLVHTFYLWRCADLTAKAASALGEKKDASLFSALAEKTRQAFHKRFYNPVTKTYGPSGSNIFALVMGVPDEVKKDVQETVREEVRAHKGHLYTGIFGTQFFFETLADNGMNELAYEAMNKKDMPGYGWWISQGATTTWEEWNGNNSRNHPMFGGGFTWFYRKMAGLNSDQQEPGYKHIIIKPYPPKAINYASYSTRTPFGQAAVSWEKQNNTFKMDVEIPVGSRATVYLPVISGKTVKECRSGIKQAKGVKYNGIKDGYAVMEVSSGKYCFETD